LDGKIEISEAGKLQILENIGEASGRDVRIALLAYNLAEEVYDQAAEAWDEWREGLGERMAEKSHSWSSKHNPVFSQDKLIKDYTNQFIRDLSREIDDWGNKILKDTILTPIIAELDENIAYELEAIQEDFQRLDQQVNTSFSDNLKLSISGINDDFMGFGGIGGGVGIGGALAAGLLIFTGMGFIAIIVASVVAAIASSFGLGMLDFDGLNDQIKFQVFEKGFAKFEESTDKIGDKLQEIINTVFNRRVESARKVIEEAIALYENLLEQQEKIHQETLEQRQAEKALISQKRQELEQVKTDLELLLTQYTV
jgi:hypothetical protein